MKKLAVLLVLLLLLGAGAGAGWWFFLRAQPDPQSAQAAEAESLILATRFIKVDPIILPVIRERQVMLHVTAVVVVELVDPMPLEDLRGFSLRLRDTFLSELHGIYAIRYVQERGYDLPVIRERLGLAAERVLGAGTVKAILLEDIDKRTLHTG
jgi:hypothetical protein